MVTQNQIQLNDGLVGIVDSHVEVNFLTLEPAIKYSKAQTGSNTDMITYFNFLLVEKNVKGTRSAYTIMDVLGALGGANRSFSIIIAFFLIPFKYNITATQIYSGLLINYFNQRKKNVFHKHNHAKYRFMNSLSDIPSIDGVFNFFWYVHDRLKSCRLQNCFKFATPCFKWDNFDKVTALMKEFKTMDLELINLIDHDTTKIFQHKIVRVFERDEEFNYKVSEDDSLSDIYYNVTVEDKEKDKLKKI